MGYEKYESTFSPGTVSESSMVLLPDMFDITLDEAVI
jgi:hypothetical protein